MKSLLLFIFLNNIGCASTTVYLCDSPNAKKYHYKEKCRGLGNCSYKIITTTLEKAKKSGKTLCGWED
ncbi:MAG: hypothetical protein ACQUHE_01525 [Bacteroidia bacterium]